MGSPQFQEVARRRCGLEESQPVVVGVSGGADSLCLLLLLAQSDYSVVVAHFDHQLRPESSQDARFVEATAHQFGFPFVFDQANVDRYAREQSLSIEEAARKLRYGFLFREARRIGAQAVAVGHTADDQVETVLMHLLRGSGLSGLKGMTYRTVIPEWDAEIPLVRPILHLRRVDTVRCCQEAGITPLEDQTNEVTTYFRNRLRHELVPLLETYNSQAKEHIARTAEILSGDHALLTELTAEALANTTTSRGAGYLGLSLQMLRSMPEALLRRLLREAIANLDPGLRDLDFQTIERAIEFVHNPSASGRIELVQVYSMQIEGETLYVTMAESIQEPGWPQLGQQAEVWLSIPGQVEIGSQWVLTGEEMLCRLSEIPDDELNDPLQAWLDGDSVSRRLLVRTRRPGDRFQPLGMIDGTAKISDYFTNRKLPRPARDRWPLVESDGQIAWVPGYNPAQWAKIKPESRRMVHLTLRRLPPTGFG